MEELLSGLIGSVIGALAGFLGSWCAAERQASHQRQSRLFDERATVVGFVGAIEAEFSVAWDRYQKRVQLELRQVEDGGIFNLQWPVRHDYFPVYRANAGLLGKIEDAGLRRQIVETYTSAQGMLDSISLNTEILLKLEKIYVENESAEGRTQELIDHLRDLLVKYASALKVSDADLTDKAEALLEALRAYTKP